ncbi:cytochrome c-type biogenesis protein CcmH [Conexibacter sp. SYSU D00693]|uniref:cytochrome c-type biogenesis protein n=1 Tax=Conexibacter sp. SYSU D00693 TaxID=2812560 RepID=UPI00196A5A42|nr:cytochrome c-type biogenesis protein CcmH [Conexibacter sp. SYSU D00693]
MRRPLLALLALLALLGPATALGATPRTSYDDVEDEVMCISCNVPLNVAESSPQAERTRELIRDLVAEGLTKEQVKDRLVAQYGRNVLAEPDDDGFGLAAYLVPLVVAAVLLGLAVVLLPRWRRRTPQAGMTATAAATPPTTTSAEEERRLEEDMARYER